MSRRVEEYARYRQVYDPEIVLPRLRKWCGLEVAWTVADAGAETGMLSDIFLANGNEVVAVEPNTEMRDEMREMCARLHEDVELKIVDGTAEAMGLEDRSVEMVAAGWALHWFNI